MEIEQIPALTPYKDESYFDSRGHYPYRKEYLTVEAPHVMHMCANSSLSITITDTTDTAITANSLNSINDDDDDDNNNNNDETDLDIKSETEFMDDEEHRATMLKLYHPAPKINTKPHNSYSKTDKSISPELLRMSKSTEPPSISFNHINNITKSTNNGGDANANEDNASALSAISAISGYHDMNHRVRPHIIDNNTENTASRISASFNFEFMDSQRGKYNKHHFTVNDELDTASDKFAAGFIEDDDDDDDDDDEQLDNLDDDEAIKTNESKSKRSYSKKSNQSKYRKKSTKSSKASTAKKDSFSFSSRHKHIAKYREYRVKDELRNKSNKSNSNSNRTRTSNSNSNTITISRTNSEGSITNYNNLSDIDPNHEDVPVLEKIQSNYTTKGRNVPIIRRIQKQIQNNIQNSEDKEEENEENKEEEEEEEHDIDTHRLFATIPQPRYLSISVSESTINASDAQMELGYNNYRYNIPQPRASKIEKTTAEYSFSTNKLKQRQKCKSKLKLKPKSKTKMKMKLNSKPKLTSKHSKYKSKTQNGTRASKKMKKIKEKQKQKHKQKKKQQQTKKKKLELERARSHNHNHNNTKQKYHFNNAPLHHYNHYSPKHQQYAQYYKQSQSQSSDKSNVKIRPLTMRCASASNNKNNSISQQSNSSMFSFESNSNESMKRDLEEIVNHFWKVIDIASNKKIPFEILKISLRVKSIDIDENNWDILLNVLTNYQPSKNITLTMFKDFIFNRKPQNTHHRQRNAQIVKILRKQLIVGLLETDYDRKNKPKLSNKYSTNSSNKSKSKTHYLRYHEYETRDNDMNINNNNIEDEEEDYNESKMKTIKFHIIPANKTSAECKIKRKTKKVKHKRSFSGYDETKSVDTLEEFGGKNVNYFVEYKENKDNYGGRARSSSHHSFLQSMRSSITSYQSHKNASEYVKYTVQQSIISSILECFENESLDKLNKSRMRSYCYRSEWKKALKYLLRCFFAHLSENQDVFTLEQFKFALYDECNIRYEFSHHILPILKLNTDDCKQQYVITEHSFIEWMLKHIDQMINLRATQSLRDRHLDKLLKIISYHASTTKAKKKKPNPFIAISPPIDCANESISDEMHMIESNKLRLLKAKSMNAMHMNHDTHNIQTPTSSSTSSSTATATHTRAYIDNNHLHLHHPPVHTSRHHYSTSHGVSPHEASMRNVPNHKFMYHYK